MKIEHAGSFLFGTLPALLIASFPTIARPRPPKSSFYGDEFYLNGQSYDFVGVNLRGNCHYGKGDLHPYTSSGISTKPERGGGDGGKVCACSPGEIRTHQERQPAQGGPGQNGAAGIEGLITDRSV